MTDETPNPGPLAAGYDGWAIVHLDSQSLVRANDAGCDLLGVQSVDFPAPLADFVTATDLTLLMNRVLPLVQSGSHWHGGLRLGGPTLSSEASSGLATGDNRIDIAPSPVMFLPHLSDDDDFDPEFASVLFGSTGVADAAALVPDPLTGLPTRSALFGRLDQAVRRNRESTDLLAAFFIDLDGLKNINDRYGHEVGDTALIETAQRISATIPEGSLAVRFGGDEFVIVNERVQDVEDALAFAEQILDVLNRVGDYHAISASIGIALSRTGEVDAQELIRRADNAMYRAKALGGSQAVLFDAEMRTKQRDDEALRSSLLSALANNGFGVAAQPIFQLATGRIIGVELFIRIRDDTPYIANANQLFRLAHEYGEAFDAAVLGRAIALSRVWRASFGKDAPRVHINVSTQSLVATKFATRVTDALRNDNIRPGSIAFEVDNRDLATAGERERNTIEALRSIGVPIVVDGFGHGALTLQTLAEWQPAMVKVAAGQHDDHVLTGLLRGVSTLRIPTCVKGIGEHDDLSNVVAIGTYAGQGNALTPVRQVERVNAQLHGPQRLGF